MELIDYAEQQGLANFQWQQRVNETTRQEANITLGFISTGGSACIAWALSNLTGNAPSVELSSAALGTSVWLFGLASMVQLRCLAFKHAIPPANQPLQIYMPEYKTLSIRVQQMEHLEQAIIQTINNGQKRAKALTKLRYAACFTPLVFLAAWALAAWCSQ